MGLKKSANWESEIFAKTTKNWPAMVTEGKHEEMASEDSDERFSIVQCFFQCLNAFKMCGWSQVGIALGSIFQPNNVREMTIDFLWKAHGNWVKFID